MAQRTIKTSAFRHGGSKYALRGETVDLDEADIARGERGDAFVTEGEELPAGPQPDPEDVGLATEEEVRAFVRSASKNTLLDWFVLNPEKAAWAGPVALDEERNGRSTRSTVVSALEQIIAHAGEYEEPDEEDEEGAGGVSASAPTSSA